MQPVPDRLLTAADDRLVISDPRYSALVSHPAGLILVISHVDGFPWRCVWVKWCWGVRLKKGGLGVGGHGRSNETWSGNTFFLSLSETNNNVQPFWSFLPDATVASSSPPLQRLSLDTWEATGVLRVALLLTVRNVRLCVFVCARAQGSLWLKSGVLAVTASYGHLLWINQCSIQTARRCAVVFHWPPLGGSTEHRSEASTMVFITTSSTLEASFSSEESDSVQEERHNFHLQN